MTYRLQFVCLGNICRSPMGEAIFRALIQEKGVAERFEVSSRGTGGWHEGESADPRTIAALQRAGYESFSHTAHRITAEDVAENELFVAMDRSHKRDLVDMGAKNVILLSEYDSEESDPDVFDPYHSDDDAFDAVLVRIERSCRALLHDLCSTHLR